MRFDRFISKTRAVIAGFTLCVVLSACSPNAEFKDFSVQNNKATVRVPQSMKYQSRDMDIGDGRMVTLHSHEVDFDDVRYGLNYFEFPEDINAEMRKVPKDSIFDGGRDGMLAQNGWKLLAEKGDAVQGVNSVGRYIVADVPGTGFEARVRILWHKNTMYQVIAVLPKKPSYNQEVYATRFLDSFRINE